MKEEQRKRIKQKFTDVGERSELNKQSVMSDFCDDEKKIYLNGKFICSYSCVNSLVMNYY